MRFQLAKLARSVDDVDLSAATDAARTGPAQWVDDGVLEIPFDRDLTPDEVEAVVLRLTSTSNADAVTRQACNTYLATDAPTDAQTVAQVKRLTRLALAMYDRNA